MNALNNTFRSLQTFALAPFKGGAEKASGEQGETLQDKVELSQARSVEPSSAAPVASKSGWGTTGMALGLCLAAAVLPGCASLGPQQGLQDVHCQTVVQGKKHQAKVILCEKQDPGFAYKAGHFIHETVVTPAVNFGKGVAGQ